MRKRAPRWRSVAMAATVTAGFYLVLIDTRSIADLVAGAVIVGLATAAFIVARRREQELFGDGSAWVRAIGTALGRVPQDLIRLTGIALRQTVSPCEHCGGWERRAVSGDRPAQRARREITGSLAPAEIVIGHDENSGELILHRIGDPR